MVSLCEISLTSIGKTYQISRSVLFVVIYQRLNVLLNNHISLPSPTKSNTKEYRT